jgi:hypothetical protein
LKLLSSLDSASGKGDIYMTSSNQAETSQSPSPPPPCSTPEAQQFDFWLGEWDLTWGESDQGTNKISKIMGGCVILEEFSGAPAMDFQGMSVSVFNQRTGLWHQTWVDNNGGYLDFKGSFENGKMVLSRTATIEGKPALQRMVWYNLSENVLDWNWERSLNGGETWDVLWSIHYKRKG